MPKFTAGKLLRTLSEAKRSGNPPLNLAKWRGELRDIRNVLIKLRDKAETEMDRLEDVDYTEIPLAQDKLYTKLHEDLEDAVDNIAEAINSIDLCL